MNNHLRVLYTHSRILFNLVLLKNREKKLLQTKMLNTSPGVFNLYSTTRLSLTHTQSRQLTFMAKKKNVTRDTINSHVSSPSLFSSDVTRCTFFLFHCAHRPPTHFIDSHAFYLHFILFSLLSDSSNCIFEGELFENEEEWYPDICTQCKCHGGNVACETQECVTLNCTGNSKVFLEAGKCCPICLHTARQFESRDATDFPMMKVNVTDVDDEDPEDEDDENAPESSVDDREMPEVTHEFEETPDLSITLRPITLPSPTSTLPPAPSTSSSPPLSSPPSLTPTPTTSSTAIVSEPASDLLPQPKIVDFEVPVTTSSTDAVPRPYSIAPENEPTEPGLLSTTSTTTTTRRPSTTTQVIESTTWPSTSTSTTTSTPTTTTTTSTSTPPPPPPFIVITEVRILTSPLLHPSLSFCCTDSLVTSRNSMKFLSKVKE